MLIKINDNNKEALLELCKANNIDIEGMYETSRTAFASDEFDRVEGIYSGIIGDATINNLRKDMDDLVDYINVGGFYKAYDSKLDKVCELLDSKPMAICPISNNLGVALLGLDELEGEATIRVGNNIINCNTYINEDDMDAIKYGELELLISDFIRV